VDNSRRYYDTLVWLNEQQPELLPVEVEVEAEVEVEVEVEETTAEQNISDTKLDAQTPEEPQDNSSFEPPVSLTEDVNKQADVEKRKDKEITDESQSEKTSSSIPPQAEIETTADVIPGLTDKVETNNGPS
jgi:membrane-bound lytic murein transglycosylase F